MKGFLKDSGGGEGGGSCKDFQYSTPLLRGIPRTGISEISTPKPVELNRIRISSDSNPESVRNPQKSFHEILKPQKKKKKMTPSPHLQKKIPQKSGIIYSGGSESLLQRNPIFNPWRNPWRDEKGPTHRQGSFWMASRKEETMPSFTKGIPDSDGQE